MLGYNSDEWVKGRRKKKEKNFFYLMVVCFVLGTDTMDVWMDSGLSWAHMKDRGVKVPVDVVLEGVERKKKKQTNKQTKQILFVDCKVRISIGDGFSRCC